MSLGGSLGDNPFMAEFWRLSYFLRRSISTWIAMADAATACGQLLATFDLCQIALITRRSQLTSFSSRRASHIARLPRRPPLIVSAYRRRFFRQARHL